jgi:hypothetical protein
MATTITVTKPDGRVYPGSTVTFTAVVAVDGVATDAAEIVFKYRIGDDSIKTGTATRSSEGTYSASVTIDADKSGFMYTLWDTQGALDTAKENVFLIEPGAFGWTRTRDYGAAL